MVRFLSIAQCSLRCRAIHRKRTVPSSLRYFAVDFTRSPTLSLDISYETYYLRYGFTRLSIIRHRCGRGSVCSALRQDPCYVVNVTIITTVNASDIFLMASRNKRLKSVYFDPKRVSSYGGVDALLRVTRVPRKIVEEWLSEQDAYTLHKPARRHFRRRRVVVGGPRQQWQADLVDLSNFKTDNDGMTFLLTVIDVFTKVAWCVPMKNKSAASLVTAL